MIEAEFRLFEKNIEFQFFVFYKLTHCVSYSLILRSGAVWFDGVHTVFLKSLFMTLNDFKYTLYCCTRVTTFCLDDKDTEEGNILEHDPDP